LIAGINEDPPLHLFPPFLWVYNENILSMKENAVKFVPYLIFLVLLSSTLGAWRITRNAVDVEIRQNFNHEVQVVKHWMQDRLNLYLPMALGMRIFFESSDSVTADEWSAYIQRLKLVDKYPATTSLTYIEWDRSKGENNYIVKYIEPPSIGENSEIVGTDLSLNQTRLDLLNSVRDEDPTSMGRVTLITTPKKGFEITLPVYKKGTTPTTIEERRRALKGFIQVEFAGSRLFQDIFDVVDSTNLSFEVYTGQYSEENLLYEQGLDYLGANPDYQPRITASDTFEFNSQTWYLVASTRPDFKLTLSQERLSMIVLSGGIFASFIFLGTYLYVERRNRKF
jgi:CHASE1-domain containing sensor protein